MKDTDILSQEEEEEEEPAKVGWKLGLEVQGHGGGGSHQHWVPPDSMRMRIRPIPLSKKFENTGDYFLIFDLSYLSYLE